MMALRVASIAVALTSSIVIARILGPHDKGVYNLVVLIPISYATLLDLGITNGNFLYLAKDQLEPGVAYGNVIAHTLATLVFIALPVVFLARGFLSNSFPNIPQIWVWVAILVLGPLTLHGLMVSGGLLMGTNRATATYAIPVVFQVFVLIGASVAAACGLRLTGVLVGFIGATFMTQILYALIHHRGAPTGLSIQPSALLRSARFGVPLYLATVLSFLHARADQFLIGSALPMSELGQYALAVSIGEVLWSIDLPVVAAVQYEVAHRSTEEAAALVHRVSRAILLVMGLACALAAISSRAIPLAYGSAYTPAIRPFLAYLPAVFFLALARAVALDIGYQHQRSDLVLYSNGAALTVNLMLLWLLLRPLGIVGASLASSGSYFLMFALSVSMHCRLTRATPRDLLLPRRSDAMWILNLARGVVRSFTALPRAAATSD